MTKNPLGKKTQTPNRYNPDLLFPISRDLARSKLNNFHEKKVNGFDLWRAYEVSWLNTSAKPEVRIAEFHFNLKSENIIESKSLKLYLNSLNNEMFKGEQEVLETLVSDLSTVSGQNVLVKLKSLSSVAFAPELSRAGSCLDEVENFKLLKKPSDQIIKVTDVAVTNEQLYSELFRSLCPVTSQPDWATFQIQYSGLRIEKKSLLEYICSYRSHASFHEDCGERIFCEILDRCKATDLTISLNFLRRGGLDINVHRSTRKSIVKTHLPRLMRQ